MDLEHFRLSDDCSPPLTADSVTPFFHDDGPFPLTPIKREFDGEGTTLNFQYTDRSQFPTRHGFGFDPRPSTPTFRRFERPSFARIAIITMLCLMAYPALYVVTLVARDLPLFTVRVIVAVWCSGVGFALRYSLLEIGVQHIQAATWATLINMSYEETGMKLGDLVRSSQNPTSFLSALRILLCRLRNRKAASSRGSYDIERPWSLGFFIFVAILGPMLPFLFGRIMDIQTLVSSQRMAYHEILIAGDLSQGDVDRANNQQGAFQSFAQTWTLLPYGTSAPDHVEFVYGNETVHFPQPSLSQFSPGRSGLGTFDANRTALLSDGNHTKFAVLKNANTPDDGIGAVLRYSQWGIRMHCKKLPDPKVNLIPFSNQTFTYAFLPQDLLRGLFASFGMDLPASLMKPDLRFLDVNDTIPSDIDPSKISYLIKWWKNGVAHSFHTRTILDTAPTGIQGWTTVETVLIRLNTSLTPSGRFPVYANVPDVNGVETRIGYDAAVCVERYEPWIIEAYNASVGFPAILRVVEKDYCNTSLPIGRLRGDPIPNNRCLNTTGKNPAFYVAHDNSVNQIVKDNGRDFVYVPSPTAVSFTDGAGPEGYIELSSDRFAIIRARVDAANVLPYLAGSGPLVAQTYPDQTLAYVTYAQWQLICLLIFILTLGVAGELFVPTLPHNMPRRGFGVYSWLALFQSQELQFEVGHDLNKLSLEELEKRLRDTEVKFFV